MKPHLIIQAVAALYGVTPSELRSAYRGQAVIEARHLAMYVIRRRLNLSLSSIGRQFGCRHHTTVIHAVRTVQRRIAQDPEFAARVNNLLQRDYSPREPIVPARVREEIAQLKEQIAAASAWIRDASEQLAALEKEAGR